MRKNAVFRCQRFEMHACAGVHPVGTDGLLLGAWVSVAGAQRILDIGTGSGLIALMLAQRTEEAAERVWVDAIDLSAAARQCAAGNFRRSPWAERLRVVGGHLAEFFPQTGALYDIVVSNPPFHMENTTAHSEQRRQSRYLHFLPMELLAEAAQHLLSPEGRLCAVLPPATGLLLAEAGALRGLYVTRLTEVRSHPHKPVERWLMQLERSPYPFERSQLDIYTLQGAYSPAYQALTGDFLLGAEKTQ